MKKLFAKSLFLLACVTASVSSLAQGPGWVQNVKVIKIGTLIDGAIVVRVSPDMTDCNTLGGYGAPFGAVFSTHPGKANIQSILLAAYMADKPVSLYLENNTCKITEVVLG